MKKFIIFISIIFLLIIGLSFWSIASSGYDRQSKIILAIKKIIPSKFAREFRDTIFFIPNLQRKNKALTLQVDKYEQGLEGKLFNKVIFKSDKNKKFEHKEFFLPFPRLDIKLGWAALEGSKRAHYLEVIGSKVLVISGLGQTIYFEKKNINTDRLNQVNIPNNFDIFLNKNNFELIGIRDLFVEDDYVYVSLQHRDSKGITINIYRAKLDYKELKFELFFKTGEYWKDYNVFSGGRIESFKNNKILFSIGYSNLDNVAQEKGSLLGKIISIDKITSKFDLLSIGHRNPQGLFYEKKKDLIINTEHGPKGGDEVNLNFLKKNETLPNFGWDIASYGTPYQNIKDPYKKSHSKYGFIEPFKNYTPAIGISEVVNISKKDNINGKYNTLYVSSLRAGSIYMLETDKDLTKIINEDRLFFKEQRLRDLEYDSELNVFFILFGYTPSIGVLRHLN